MEVQIFGIRKSADTRAALRFFAERRVKTHFVDLNERAASPGELRRFAQKFGVRALIERGVLEMMANLYGAPGPQVCLNPDNDPLGDVATAGVTGGYTPAYNNLASNNAHSREDPYRWDRSRDPPDAADRRGRY